MIKFSKNLNLILLISLICKCSLCSNETFQETTNFDEENADFEFEDTTIDDFEMNPENGEFTLEDTTIDDFETQPENGEITFEDTSIDDFETKTETDDLFRETSGEASTSAIKFTTQERSSEETNDSTNANDLTTKPSTYLITTKLATNIEDPTYSSKSSMTQVTEQKSTIGTESTENETEDTTNSSMTQVTEQKSTIGTESTGNETEDTTNSSMTQVTELKRTIEVETTRQIRSSFYSFSNANRETSFSVPFSIPAVGTSSLSTQPSLLNSDPTSLSTTLKVVEIPEFPFSTRIQMNGIVRNRRIRVVKRVLIQLDRILFIDDVNVTNIEQALLKSIGYDSIFNVTNEGNDEYSIGFTTEFNTSVNSALSLDDSVLKIVQNLKRDENIIQAEAKKVGFESSIDTSKAVIFATEILVLNGITYIIICEKTLDQVQMTCQQGTVENGTITIESTSEVDLESLSNSSCFSKFLLIVVTIIFSFQIMY